MKGASFLVTKRRTRCIMGLDLQGQVGISTIERPASNELSRHEMVLSEQSEFSNHSKTRLKDKEFQNSNTPFIKFKSSNEGYQFTYR